MARKARYEQTAAEVTGPMVAFRDLAATTLRGGDLPLFADPSAPVLFADEARAHSARMRAQAATTQRVVRVVDLFSGAGGGSRGVAAAVRSQGDIVDLKAVNHNPYACASFVRAHPDAMIARWPVDGVTPSAVAPDGETDLLIAGPSCNPFTSNNNGAELDPVERALCWHILPFLKLLRVKYVLIENVVGFLDLGPMYPHDYPNPKLRNRPIQELKGTELDAYIQALRACGYNVDVRVQCAADFGVPQERYRVIILAARYGQPLRWPVPTHGDADAVATRGVLPWVSAESIIDWADTGLPITHPSKASLSPDYTLPLIAKGIAQGLTRFIVPRKQGTNRYVRDVARPFQTVTASAPGHGVISVIDGVAHHRALREDELLAAQSFPRDYPLAPTTKEERYRLIGNAMPSLMIQRHVEALLYGINAIPAGELTQDTARSRVRRERAAVIELEERGEAA